MAQAPKIIAQSKPSAASLTTLYTVPAATSVVGSTLTVCNQSATPTAFRVSVAIAGAGDTAAQYIFYDSPINGNSTVTVTIGWTLATTDLIRVYNTLATLSFNLFGVLIT